MQNYDFWLFRRHQKPPCFFSFYLYQCFQFANHRFLSFLLTQFAKHDLRFLSSPTRSANTSETNSEFNFWIKSFCYPIPSNIPSMNFSFATSSAEWEVLLPAWIFFNVSPSKTAKRKHPMKLWSNVAILFVLFSFRICSTLSTIGKFS